MTILGDAGVGKTRLLRELWEWLAGCSPAPLRRTGRCLSYGQGITYWPLAEVLKEHFGLLEAIRRCRRLALADHPFLGLTLGQADAGLHPLAARERLHDAWVEFIDEVGRSKRPVAPGRGHPLGRRRSLRPARDPDRACTRPAASARHCPDRAVRPPSGLGRERETRRRSCSRRFRRQGRRSCSTRCSGWNRRTPCASSSSSAPKATRSSSRS